MLSAVLDVAIGVIMLFLVLSAAASAISEYISSSLKWRSKDLQKFLLHAFASPPNVPSGAASGAALQAAVNASSTAASEAVKAFLTPFLRDKGNLDYIATEDFVRGVFGILAATPGFDPTKIQASVDLLPDSPLKTVLTSMVNTGQIEIKQVHDALANWYDNSMDTLTSWYKKHLSRVLLLIGLVLAIGLNIDAVAYANMLFESPATRAAIAAQAAPTTPPTITTPEQLQTELNKLDLPIGWTATSLATLPDISKDLGRWLVWWSLKIAGLLITAFAVSQGAPFWFDLLNKITNLRSGAKPETPEKPSKDAAPARVNGGG